MAYSAALNTVYNHYLTTYAPRSSSRYDTHKKSELRSIYNSIVKLNKESPLYLLDTSKESQSFAVGLKENARQLRNTIASLGGLDEGELLNKKTAYSSNTDLVEASFIGEIPEDGDIPCYDIEVNALASGQTNIGSFLPASRETSLPEDTYSFDITINDLSYEFQYNIHDGETNKEIQERLSRLITNADIGLKADIIEDGSGNCALRLSSTATGIKNDHDILFHVSDENTSKQKGSVDYFGIDSIAVAPSNAEFVINGEARSASSNHFTIEKMFEVQLNSISTSKEDIARIGVKADVDSLTENISNLIDGYNSFISSTSGYSDSYPKSSRLVGEMSHIAALYSNEFEKMGVSYNEAGTLSLDKDTLRQAALSDGGQESLDTIKDFANSVLRKTGQISLNPMQYVEKTIVAYKNPGHNFATPYVTSAYSGMMFNSYC
ncbi:MAG: flagellar capping protein [Suilimivivens sp.]